MVYERQLQTLKMVFSFFFH